MNFFLHKFSFSTLIFGIALLFVGIFFINSKDHPFISPICGINGFTIFFCSFVIFEYEKKTINNVTDSSNTISIIYV
jgi:uncharacterized membrane protein